MQEKATNKQKAEIGVLSGADNVNLIMSIFKVLFRNILFLLLIFCSKCNWL